jgi:hypothetical protein
MKTILDYEHGTLCKREKFKKSKNKKQNYDHDGFVPITLSSLKMTFGMFVSFLFSLVYESHPTALDNVDNFMSYWAFGRTLCIWDRYIL